MRWWLQWLQLADAASTATYTLAATRRAPQDPLYYRLSGGFSDANANGTPTHRRMDVLNEDGTGSDGIPTIISL